MECTLLFSAIIEKAFVFVLSFGEKSLAYLVDGLVFLIFRETAYEFSNVNLEEMLFERMKSVNTMPVAIIDERLYIQFCVYEAKLPIRVEDDINYRCNASLHKISFKIR